MATYVINILPFSSPTCPLHYEPQKTSNLHFLGNSLCQQPVTLTSCKSQIQPVLAAINVEEKVEGERGKEKPKFRWVEIGPNIPEEQKQAISQLPFKMTKRCKALMRQIICFNDKKGSLPGLLSAWVKIMKPRRKDWLSILKELNKMEHPLYLEVAEIALLEESFEANVRDYTKIIHFYGMNNQLEEAERTRLAMEERGFVSDQVTLTAMIHMYSKAGNLTLAEETFEELKLLGQPLDRRSYGSMIMAYIRAGMPEKGEMILREMDAQEIRAGSEVYKALLRAYSIVGDADGAQRVFDAIQLAGIPPDDRTCAVLLNAYGMAGQSQNAHATFENMWRAGIEPSDRCVALVLAAYEKENKLIQALDFLMGLEREKLIIGKEASEVLAEWFGRLGVVKEVELVLREYATG